MVHLTAEPVVQPGASEQTMVQPTGQTVVQFIELTVVHPTEQTVVQPAASGVPVVQPPEQTVMQPAASEQQWFSQ